MRLHLALLGATLAVFLAWLLLWPRETSPDLVRARDLLVSSEAVTVHFDPGGAGGYRFIHLRDEGWLWERTDEAGNPYPDALLFNGEHHLLRVADACYIPIHLNRQPLIPGITVAARLARQPGLDDGDGDTYVYSIAPGFASRADYPSTLEDLEVSEDLSALRSTGTVHASTGTGPGFIWRGDYSIARASEEELARARDALATWQPSDYAEVVIRERVIGNILGFVSTTPSSVVIAEHCPGNPARIWPAAHGAQVEGLRTTPAAFTLTHGAAPVFREAYATTMAFAAPIHAMNEVLPGLVFGDVPVTTTSTILINRGPNDGIALQIVSCTSRPWFQC